MRVTLFLAAVLAASPVLGQTSTTRFESVSGVPEVDRTTQTDDLRLKNDLNDRMTVPVRVSGSGPFRFLVDTGADRTVVSRQLAAHLKLPAASSVILHSTTGASVVQTANVPHLEVGRRALDVQQSPLLEAEHMGADGILGVDSLRSQRVVFDFDAKTMSIVPSASPKVEKADVVVTGRLRKGRLIVTDAIADGAFATVIVDTGSEVSIGNAALRQRLLGRRGVNQAMQIEVQSVTGQTLVGEMVRVKRLEIGGVTLKDLIIVFADAHTFLQLGFEERPSLLLGMNALRAFRKVSIDFDSRRLRLLLRDRSSLNNVLLASR